MIERVLGMQEILNTSSISTLLCTALCKGDRGRVFGALTIALMEKGGTATAHPSV